MKKGEKVVIDVLIVVIGELVFGMIVNFDVIMLLIEVEVMYIL